MFWKRVTKREPIDPFTILFREEWRETEIKERKGTNEYELLPQIVTFHIERIGRERERRGRVRKTETNVSIQPSPVSQQSNTWINHRRRCDRNENKLLEEISVQTHQEANEQRRNTLPLWKENWKWESCSFRSPFICIPPVTPLSQFYHWLM